jgi:anaerobic magnesium-protoporphyrin IX monomethyl ester cyclase
MGDRDFILIVQSDSINYAEYSKLPLERIELYSELIFPRMVYYKNGFRSHLDIINYARDGIFFNDADYPRRRQLLNIWNLPGMNGLHLAQYLGQYGIVTQIINNFDSEWDIFCRSYDSCKKHPLIGISTTFYLSYAELKRIIKQIRKFYPKSEIVVGGAFISEQAINGKIEDFETHMRNYGINYVLHAFNSEIDLKDLINNRKNNKDFEHVANLVYIEGGDFASGKYKMNFCKWHQASLDFVPNSLCPENTSFLNHTVQLRTSSGCPFSCSFCSYSKTAKEFCTMSFECIEKQIGKILRLNNINKIIFIDDTINVSPQRFKKICKIFRNYDFEWFSFLRVQFIDDETARLMKESGCVGVYLGIESANETVLKNMNKKATRIEFLKGINYLKKYGIISVAAFIIGFPGETEDSIREDIDFIENSGVEFYTLKEFYFMKHTPIYELREKFSLSGLANNWKHKTMDYYTAHQNKILMFKSIKNSIFVDADTNLWFVAYLYDQGYSIDSIALIQKEINRVLVAQINGVFDDNHVSFKNIKKLTAKGSQEWLRLRQKNKLY